MPLNPIDRRSATEVAEECRAMYRNMPPSINAGVGCGVFAGQYRTKEIDAMTLAKVAGYMEAVARVQQRMVEKQNAALLDLLARNLGESVRTMTPMAIGTELLKRGLSLVCILPPPGFQRELILYRGETKLGEKIEAARVIDREPLPTFGHGGQSP